MAGRLPSRSAHSIDDVCETLSDVHIALKTVQGDCRLSMDHLEQVSGTLNSTYDLLADVRDHLAELNRCGEVIAALVCLFGFVLLAAEALSIWRHW